MAGAAADTDRVPRHMVAEMSTPETTLQRAVEYCRQVNAHRSGFAGCVMDVGDDDGEPCNETNCASYREVVRNMANPVACRWWWRWFCRAPITAQALGWNCAVCHRHAPPNENKREVMQ